MIAITLLLSVLTANAQNNNGLSVEVWKQKVVRNINIAYKLDSNGRTKDRFSVDSAFFQPIFSQVLNGTIAAYGTDLPQFTRRLSLRELNDSDVSDRDQDSITIVDPITNEEKTIALRKGPDYANIHKIAILEEWSFYPYTGKTEIKVNGIAPVVDLYDEYGIFRGSQKMIWVRYDDVRNLIDKYDQDHQGNMIANLIWDDYFSRDITCKNNAQKNGNNSNEVWKEIIIRDIDLATKEDTNHHWIGAISVDSLLFERIINAMKAGKLQGYRSDDLGFSNKLSYKKLKPLPEYISDTTIYKSQSEKADTVIQHTYIDYTKFHKYKILEEWSFDPLAKETKVNILGIAPIYEIYRFGIEYIGSQTMFWLRYSDVQNMINNYRGQFYYNQHSWENSMPGTIWENYFFSDVKPKTLN